MTLNVQTAMTVRKRTKHSLLSTIDHSILSSINNPLSHGLQHCILKPESMKETVLLNSLSVATTCSSPLQQLIHKSSAPVGLASHQMEPTASSLSVLYANWFHSLKVSSRALAAGTGCQWNTVRLKAAATGWLQSWTQTELGTSMGFSLPTAKHSQSAHPDCSF